MAYYEVEPFGESRADLRAGIVSSTLANCHRGKNVPAFEPADFMPDFDGSRKKKTDREMEMIFTHFAMLHNATATRKKKP